MHSHGLLLNNVYCKKNMPSETARTTTSNKQMRSLHRIVQQLFCGRCAVIFTTIFTAVAALLLLYIGITTRNEVATDLGPSNVVMKLRGVVARGVGGRSSSGTNETTTVVETSSSQGTRGDWMKSLPSFFSASRNKTTNTVGKGATTVLELPPWTYLPRSQFTDHVLGIIHDMNLTLVSQCAHHYTLTVATPNSIPQVECQSIGHNESTWCQTLQHIFASRPIPYNVSIGIVLSDGFEPDPSNKEVDNENISSSLSSSSSCLGNSSPGGKLVVPNKVDIHEMLRMQSLRRTNPNFYEYRWQFRDDIPWEERHPIPIYRGKASLASTLRKQTTARWGSTATHEDCINFLQSPHYQAVEFSKLYPTLLDARFRRIGDDLKPCLEDYFQAHEFDARLATDDSIPKHNYFSKFQVVLVLAATHAATFRTTIHFMTGTAVVLQDCVYQEWFTKYLEPYVHYIPVSEDLHDLNETLHWIQDHPAEVKAIAGQGRLFWEAYLTFQGHEEHIYELVYRMSEYTHYVSDNEGLPGRKRPPSIVHQLPGRAYVPEQLKASFASPPSTVLETIELPTWTALPRSQFTENVLGIIHDIKIAETSSCSHFSILCMSLRRTPSHQSNASPIRNVMHCGSVY